MSRDPSPTATDGGGHGTAAAGETTVHRTLDVIGLNCPLPILKTRVALRQMRPGEVIRVLATDAHAEVDFRAYCARTGHELLGIERNAEGVLDIRVRVAAAPRGDR